MNEKDNARQLYEVIKRIDCDNCPLEEACDLYDCEYKRDFCSLLREKSKEDME